MRQRLTLKLLLLALALLAALALSRYLPPQLLPIENVLNDWRVRIALQPRLETRIVVIDIDERSLAEAGEGPWPWPRPTIARLLKTLIDDYGVASIAADMFLPEQRPDEADLAVQLRRPQVTGAVIYDLDGRNLPPLQTPLPVPPPLQAAADAPLARGPAVLSNHAGLMPLQAGHINPSFDDDGAMRRMAPLICATNSPCRPNLTMTAFMSLLDQPRMTLTRGQGLLAPHWMLAIGGPDGLPMASLPLNRDGMLVVPYRHAKRDWTYISAVDILNKKAEASLLKGVMVLLGGTALGMQDVIATPISPLTVGFEPHLEVLSAMLDNDFPRPLQWGEALDAGILLPFALLLLVLPRRIQTPTRRAVLFPAWLLLAWLAGAAIALIALRQFNLLLPLVPLLVFPPLAALLIILAELHLTSSAHAGIASLLAAYLPAPVAAHLARSRGQGAAIDSAVDASRRTITVMFADVHGFTGITETCSPEVTARLMQKVFTEMAEAVVVQQGTIDKFIGDAIMAFWNAPEDDPAHAHHALAAAKDIQQRIESLAPFCKELGLQPITVGIGIETGEALVGNFGSAHRRTFTALGPPVVLASRIEGLTTRYNEPLLIGPACAEALGSTPLRTLGDVAIRGRIQALKLYAPT